MDMKEVGTWTTATGAFVAAVAGVWNLMLQLKGRRDVYRVGIGSLIPQVRDETMMHIVSLSCHRVIIADYGFILEGPGVISVPLISSINADNTYSVIKISGNILHDCGDFFECGMDIKEHTLLGVYARSNIQIFPRIYFSANAPLLKRLSIRWNYFIRKKIYVPKLF